MRTPISILSNIDYKQYKVDIMAGFYHSGGLAIMLRDHNDHEPVSVLTRWFDGIPENCVALDINNNGKELIGWLQLHNIIEGTDSLDAVMVIPSGYCDYPVYKLHEDLLKQL